MKIWCAVCDKEEASVFCSSDEAALCNDCDRRVHHANKLASKHTRFSLLHPNFKNSPLCDICQEKRAFLFCQQDRAILCRECDTGIHKTNEHTQKHDRFLLTGVTLSPSSSSSSPASSSKGSINKKNKNLVKSSVDEQSPSIISENGYGSTSSTISESLMETLPSWHVDDLLYDPSSTNSFWEIWM